MKQIIDRAPHRMLDVDALARVAAMNRTKLRSAFRQVYGTTLSGYRTEIMLQRADRALKEAGASVKQAGHHAGYATTSSFIVAYKRQYGFCPGDRSARLSGSRAKGCGANNPSCDLRYPSRRILPGCRTYHNRKAKNMVQNVIGQSEQVVPDLQAQMQGRVTARGDQGYENARKVWNGAVDHYPAAIAFCESTEDVQAAVRTARAHDMPVSVRSAGHDVAGRSVRPDALVIDLSRMNQVRIDDQIATVAGGATAAKVIAAATASNLMAVTGWNGVPGMIGLTTVGGYGPLIASHGLALDQPDWRRTRPCRRATRHRRSG